jgi:hypothetical protein
MTQTERLFNLLENEKRGGGDFAKEIGAASGSGVVTKASELGRE